MATVDAAHRRRRHRRRRRARRRRFGVEPNVAVMHQVVTAQLAAARSGTQSTKTRAEVRGGGAKPWRQKGTGRARQGSIRAPHWRGGGVALAPEAPLATSSGRPRRWCAWPCSRRCPTGPPRAGSWWSTRWDVRRAEHQGGRGRPRRPRPHRQGRGRARRRGRGGGQELPQPARRPRAGPPASSTPTTCCAATGWSSPGRRCRAAGAGRRPRGCRRRPRPRPTPAPEPRPRRWTPDGPPRRDPRPGRQREVLRPARRQRLHLPGPPRRQQDRDPPGDRVDLRREGGQGGHPQPQGQAQAQPPHLHLRVSGPTPSGRSSPWWPATASTCSRA